MRDPDSGSGGFCGPEQLVERVLRHIDAGTTDMAGAMWQEPVTNYLDPSRLDRELALFRRLPVPFCPTTAVSEPGDYTARTAAGVPTLVVRGADGTVRAFRNACRHRGAAVAEGSGCAKAFTCQFHGWTYGTDGRLRRIPHAEGFEELDRDGLGLASLHAIELGGVVFVSAEPVRAQDLAGLHAVGPLLGPAQVLVETETLTIEANWKVLTEGFLEGYHIAPTHRQSFLPFGYDNVNVVETSGPHHRVTFPFRRIEKLRHEPRAHWDPDGLVTSVVHVFPNVVFAHLSHHTSMIVMEPWTIDRTDLVIHRLARDADPESLRRAARDAVFVHEGLMEDRAVAQSVHDGLRSGANTHLTFGLFEEALSDLHRTLRTML